MFLVYEEPVPRLPVDAAIDAADASRAEAPRLSISSPDTRNQSLPLCKTSVLVLTSLTLNLHLHLHLH